MKQKKINLSKYSREKEIHKKVRKEFELSYGVYYYLNYEGIYISEIVKFVEEETLKQYEEKIKELEQQLKIQVGHKKTIIENLDKEIRGYKEKIKVLQDRINQLDNNIDTVESNKDAWKKEANNKTKEIIPRIVDFLSGYWDINYNGWKKDRKELIKEIKQKFTKEVKK